MRALAIAIAIFLLGCLPTSTKVEMNCFNTLKVENHKLTPVLCNEQLAKRKFEHQSFSIEVPGNVFRQLGDIDDVWLIEYKNDFKNSEKEIESSIHVLPNFSSLCSPFALGVSNLKEREIDGKKVWTGLVDAYDGGILYDYVNNDAPPCRPPNMQFSASEYGDGMSRGDNSAAYALCSETDVERVVVCIQQMTDNPKLAEEIFSTFRWTE
jgi:hypothetical protein